MIAEDRGRVLNGQVELDGRWVSIERKYTHEQDRIRKIRDGYMEFQGEWVSIEEKYERVVRYQESDAPTRPMRMQQKGSKTVVHIHHNDNRSYHEHRHVHLDGETAGRALADKSGGLPPREVPLIEDDSDQGHLEGPEVEPD